MNKKKTLQRLGEEKYNNSGDLMRIIEYNGNKDITVEFQDDYKYIYKHVDYGNFKKGTVRNPYHKFLYDKGYLGVGEYTSSQNRKGTKCYDAWRRMFDRCYKKELHDIESTYLDCEVDKIWWDYQNFAEWFYGHYIDIPNQSIQVDKDWIVCGNKTYSPEYCELVPQIINSCIIGHDKIINNDLPMGITMTSSGKYKPRVSQYGKRIHYGSYVALEDAMKIYMDQKILYIKELADKYKPYISQRLYDTMYNYKNRFLLENPEYEKIQ